MNKGENFMQPDEQWRFDVLVYPQDRKIWPAYAACIMPSNDNPLIEGMTSLTGRGDTPALAIADLFHQANRLLEKE